MTISPEIGEIKKEHYPSSVDEQVKQLDELLERRRVDSSLGGRAVDPWSDLGGGVAYTPEPWYADGLRAAATDERYVDLRAAFEQFDLASITKDDIVAMAQRERDQLAAHLQNFSSRLASRARTLSLEGNWDNPAFSAYGFDNDREAQYYAAVVGAFHRSMAAQPQLKILLDMHFTERQLANTRSAGTLQVYRTGDNTTTKLRVKTSSAKRASAA